MDDQAAHILIDAEKFFGLHVRATHVTQGLLHHLLRCSSEPKGGDKEPGQGKVVNVVRCRLSELRGNLGAKLCGIWN